MIGRFTLSEFHPTSGSVFVCVSMVLLEYGLRITTGRADKLEMYSEHNILDRDIVIKLEHLFSREMSHSLLHSVVVVVVHYGVTTDRRVRSRSIR